MRNESEDWLKAYQSESAKLDRKKKLRRRLKYFDWSKIPKAPRWVDLCCGHGEALDLLIEQGIEAPTGVDLTFDATLKERKDIHWKLADATETHLPSHSYDVVSNFHALHHLQSPDKIQLLMNEADRLLQKNGQLLLIDFPNSLAIRLAFKVFRLRFFGFERWWLGSRFLIYFSLLVREEWPFLSKYLLEWDRVQKILINDPRFEVIQYKKKLFYFYLQLRKRD